MLSTQHIINTSMKLCVLLILVTATSVIADGHADICSTQFNWWFRIAKNAQPKDSEDTQKYGLETPEEKIRRLTKVAYSKFGYSESEMPIPTMCEMQQNANGYYDFWEEVLREINPDAENAPGFGFPFQSKTGKTYTGLTATCVKEDSILGNGITFSDLQAAGGPAASCAYGYPGSRKDVKTTKGTLKIKQFENVASTCRLKIFGSRENQDLDFKENQDLELQWCVTNILGSMVVGKKGGYYDGIGSKTPDLKCSLQTSFSDANQISGTNINPPYAGAPYPTKDLGGSRILGPNPLPKDTKSTVYVCNNTNDTTEPSLGPFKQGSPNDPYQSFPILFRQLADQKVAGMCDVCEECVYGISNKYGYPKPEKFCEIVGMCEPTKSSKSKSSKKNSKNNRKNKSDIIMI